jgi:hypothetical protein
MESLVEEKGHFWFCVWLGHDGPMMDLPSTNVVDDEEGA